MRSFRQVAEAPRNRVSHYRPVPRRPAERLSPTVTVAFAVAGSAGKRDISQHAVAQREPIVDIRLGEGRGQVEGPMRGPLMAIARTSRWSVSWAWAPGLPGCPVPRRAARRPRSERNCARSHARAVGQRARCRHRARGRSGARCRQAPHGREALPPNEITCVEGFAGQLQHSVSTQRVDITRRRASGRCGHNQPGLPSNQPT